LELLLPDIFQAHTTYSLSLNKQQRQSSLLRIAIDVCAGDKERLLTKERYGLWLKVIPDAAFPRQTHTFVLEWL